MRRTDSAPRSRRRSATASPQLVAIGDLVGVAELATRAHVAPDTVHAWRRRTYLAFPAPLVTLAAGPVWSWADVAAWLAVDRPPGPRPRIRA